MVLPCEYVLRAVLSKRLELQLNMNVTICSCRSAGRDSVMLDLVPFPGIDIGGKSFPPGSIFLTPG